jgi:hypothetical protein
MRATLIAYSADGQITHHDARDYPELGLLWEHICCQQNNRRTIKVCVRTDPGLYYEIDFLPWTPGRRFRPSRQFVALLESWAGEYAS